jgi:eukaryotic-like serine/threonine-protein kinase
LDRCTSPIGDCAAGTRTARRRIQIGRIASSVSADVKLALRAEGLFRYTAERRMRSVPDCVVPRGSSPRLEVPETEDEGSADHVTRNEEHTGDHFDRAASGLSREGALPIDPLHDTARRLALFCAGGAATWATGVVMGNVLQPLSVPTPFPWPGNPIGAGMIGLLSVSFLYVRRTPKPFGAWTRDLGLGLLVINALAIAVINEWAPAFPDLRYVSWNAILILTYAIVAPTTPLRMFVACLLAASMDPLAAGIANLQGLMAPSLGKAVALYYPNYICAVIALLPSIRLDRMQSQIADAHSLGSYQLVEQLAHGGMGEVWRAEHRLLARPAAIKLVRPEMLGLESEEESRAVLQRFEREAQATAVLSSPHTIDLFDFGLTNDGAFYYVMELLVGRDLQALVHEFGALPADRVAYLLRQVCHSLAEAHARGLVHGDIKPANVYVCRMGLDYDFVKVLDFGLVKFSSRETRSTLLSVDRVTLGTPAFMAPEVILGEGRVDQRADIYSLGCLAYWMLTGQLVFEAHSPMKMLMAHVDMVPVPPSQRTELPIPRELEQIVLACLEKDPGKRPQNGEVLWDMSFECKGRGAWSRAAARQWWESHLPELTSPHVLATPAARPNRIRNVAVAPRGDGRDAVTIPA